MSTLNQGAKRPEDREWWDDLPDESKIDIQPTGQEAQDLAAAKRARRGFFLVFFNVIVRIYCFIIGVVMIAYGAWILYEIRNNEILPLPIIANVCMGIFLILAGFLTVLAEARNRKTMANCLNTYIIVANHLARGVFYLVVGALVFPMNVLIPIAGQFGNSKVLAGLIVAGGLMNIAYYPFKYQFSRKKAISEQPVRIANAEELAYNMHIIYTADYKKEHPLGADPVDTTPLATGNFNGPVNDVAVAPGKGEDAALASLSESLRMRKSGAVLTRGKDAAEDDTGYTGVPIN